MSVELEGFAKMRMTFLKTHQENAPKGSRCYFGARAHLSGTDFLVIRWWTFLFVLVHRANRCKSGCD